MAQIPITRNNQAFRAELRRSGEGKVPPLQPDAVAKLGQGVTILIGDRTPEFGGGLAGTGFVMQGGKAVGTIAVDRAQVERGWFTTP